MVTRPMPKRMLPAAKKIFIKPSITVRYIEVSTPPCLSSQFSASAVPKLTLKNSNINGASMDVWTQVS